MNTKPAVENPNRPAHEIRHGGIKLAIWANQTEKGTRYNVTFERSYKDGEEWKSTQSFGRDDLLLLGLMSQWAFEWIVAQPGNGHRA